MLGKISFGLVLSFEKKCKKLVSRVDSKRKLGLLKKKNSFYLRKSIFYTKSTKV